jgi:hypothetical protein
VPPDDKAAFLGRFRAARSSIECSGRELGFAFRASGTTNGGYAELGFERNGSFL